MALDLFCGVGGATLGLKRAGFKVIGAVDRDGLAAEAYLMNHPGTALWKEDIALLGTGEVMRALSLRKGELDLLAGAPPCRAARVPGNASGTPGPGPRPGSAAGGAAPAAGAWAVRAGPGGPALPRRPGRPVAGGDTLLEYERFAAELLPRAALLVAPAGLAGSRRFAGFRRRMAALGYLGAWRILDTADFGVALRRRRLVYLAGLGFPVPVTLGRGGLATVRDAIGALPPPGGIPDPAHAARPVRAPAALQAVPRDGGSLADTPGVTPPAVPRSSLRYPGSFGRLPWDAPAPESTRGALDPARARCLHPEEDRPLTLRELALVSGLPAGFRLPPPAGRRPGLARAVGAAPQPALVEAQAANVLRAISPPAAAPASVWRAVPPRGPKPRRTGGAGGGAGRRPAPKGRAVPAAADAGAPAAPPSARPDPPGPAGRPSPRAGDCPPPRNP
ncbi:MAG: DNA cytosine methyltransferase [Deltaproteobacteria bacterium]|jgi:DNA (cytosine-5)-methyltransferase 1|nr:DNA cytosine methyltransferase [Deltaproteobacteria bacterium]